MNTFLDAYDAENVTITVNGKSFNINCTDYKDPLTWYAVEGTLSSKSKITDSSKNGPENDGDATRKLHDKSLYVLSIF